jgi:hypothetical protein
MLVVLMAAGLVLPSERPMKSDNHFFERAFDACAVSQPIDRVLDVKYLDSCL